MSHDLVFSLGLPSRSLRQALFVAWLLGWMAGGKATVPAQEPLLNRVGSSLITQAGVAAQSPTLGPNPVLFVPQFKGGMWWGDLSAYAIDAKTGDHSGPPQWSASQAMPPPAQRHLWTWDASSRSAREFIWAQLGAANQAALGPSGSVALVDYLRGDHSLEGAGDTQYRDRHGHVLGDFVNCAPLFVDARAGLSSGLIFIGGNDGYLHVFDQDDGREVFGFVPHGVMSKLALLAARDYGSPSQPHQYFVDGPLAAATIAPGRTVVVGSLGAGARALYAVDATAASEQAGAKAVLWDWAASDADPAVSGPLQHLGFVTARAQMGQMPNGQWKVFVGNGAMSGSGTSALLIVDLLSGAIDELVLDTTSQTDPATGQLHDIGLSGVALGLNSAGKVARIYAGDLQGKVWRMDVSAEAKVSVAFEGQPLFQARGASGQIQAISAAPAVMRHPRGGYMVLIGTGRLLTHGDASDVSVQTLYGVWDKESLSASAQELRSKWLVQQSVLSSSASTGYFAVTQHAVDWAQQRGWFLDLSAASGTAGLPGLRVLFAPQLLKDTVYFNAVAPPQAPFNGDSSQGMSLNVLLPALSGAQRSLPVLDSTGDGLVNLDDALVSAYLGAADGEHLVISLGPTHLGEELADRSSTLACRLLDASAKAQACRLLGASLVKDRVWRSIINPPF